MFTAPRGNSGGALSGALTTGVDIDVPLGNAHHHGLLSDEGQPLPLDGEQPVVVQAV